MNETKQKVIIGNSIDLSMIEDKSIDLIITSPPYPMISMWDETFNALNGEISKKLINDEPKIAFELMHAELDKIYIEAIKKLKDDGIVVINIGDATRTCKKNFSLYPNGSRTIEFFTKNGFDLLPSIIWNKPTNSPNKFMGSGMLPIGAYNTLEFEHILIFKKSKREFYSSKQKNNRNESAFFWNERNIWCNNIWNFVGERQKNKNDARERNGAFPLELPYRIVSMWTCKNDTVLDIFGGTGTTLLACAALNRNGIIVELQKEFKSDVNDRLINAKEILNKKNQDRLKNQINFVNDRISKGKEIKYINNSYNIPVVTKQEINIKLPYIDKIYLNFDNGNESEIIIKYED